MEQVIVHIEPKDQLAASCNWQVMRLDQTGPIISGQIKYIFSVAEVFWGRKATEKAAGNRQGGIMQPAQSRRANLICPVFGLRRRRHLLLLLMSSFLVSSSDAHLGAWLLLDLDS